MTTVRAGLPMANDWIPKIPFTMARQLSSPIDIQRGILAMKSLLMASLIIGLTVQSPWSAADWWSDNDDNADVQDIDAGAKPETSADDDLVRNAVGPGQPQNDDQSPSTGVIYDAWGRPYAYGMPYGYGPGFGYGYGYMSGPYDVAGRAGGGGRR